jgi:hypothetical protein
VLDTTLADLAFPWRAAVRVEKVSDGEQGAAPFRSDDVGEAV